MGDNDPYELINENGKVVFTGTLEECLKKKEELSPTRVHQSGEKLDMLQIRKKSNSR